MPLALGNAVTADVMQAEVLGVAALLQFCHHQEDGPGLVYCPRRRTGDTTAGSLSACSPDPQTCKT